MTCIRSLGISFLPSEKPSRLKSCPHQGCLEGQRLAYLVESGQSAIAASDDCGSGQRRAEFGVANGLDVF